MDAEQQTLRQTDKLRQTEKHTHCVKQIPSNHIYSYTNKMTKRSDRQKNRQIDRQTKKQIDKQTGRQTKKQINGQTKKKKVIRGPTD